MSGTEWQPVSLRSFEAIGGVFTVEVDEHPHGLIPTEDGAVIHVHAESGGYVVVLGGCWWAAGGGGLSADRVQADADRYGFDVLVPESRVELLEGGDE